MPTRRTATVVRAATAALTFAGKEVEAAYLAQDGRFAPKEMTLTAPINLPTADSIGGAP